MVVPIFPMPLIKVPILRLKSTEPRCEFERVNKTVGRKLLQSGCGNSFDRVVSGYNVRWTVIHLCCPHRFG